MADEARRTKLSPLDDAEAFRLLVATVEDCAIFFLDREGRVATWNAGAERIKGYRADEIVGKHFSVFYTEDDVRAGKCDFELAVAEREGRYQDEGWRVRKDGSHFWADVIISAVRDEHQTLIGFAKVTRDLTERRRAEDERIHLAQAQEAVRLRDEFLAIAAHELRTPLTAVQLQLQSLRARLARGEPGAIERLDRAIGGCRRLTGLIDLLLDVSRIASGRISLDRQKLDLSALVRQLVDELGEAAYEAGCPILLRADEPVVGEWDRLRVEEVVTNLLANAFKYGSKAPIEITVAREGEMALLSVTDHGPGVSEADLPRIFGRFERAVPMNHYGGLGLGLYVAREIAIAHGGTVKAERPSEGGARFVLCLPLAARVGRMSLPAA
jgi:PAS domain S-box-containing protein